MRGHTMEYTFEFMSAVLPWIAAGLSFATVKWNRVIERSL
jgi:hypothetical protein